MIKSEKSADEEMMRKAWWSWYAMQLINRSINQWECYLQQQWFKANSFCVGIKSNNTIKALTHYAISEWWQNIDPATSTLKSP